MLNLSRGMVFLLFLSLYPLVLTAGDNTVAINEIAWMGTENSSYDEWIELYNNTPAPISVDGWTLKNAGETISIGLKGIVPPYGFYLLERTDDNSVLDIKADLIYKGSLKNSGEKLELFDNSNNLADSVNCEEGWFSGDNKTKQTMERDSSGEEWHNSQEKYGSPKSKNSEGLSLTLPTIPEEREIIPQENGKKETAVYPSGIILNEMLPSPEGEDSKEEWIEIFNRNNFEVDLSGWKITDTVGKTTSYVFPGETKIKPEDFFVVYRPITKIILNNDEDGLQLLNPNEDTIDERSYGKAVLGQSYSLFGEKWGWGVPTPGEENKKFSEGENADKIAEKEVINRDLAAIGEQAQNSPKSFMPLLISSIIAVLAGITILLIKKLQQNKNLLQ
ncbi:MAG: lamin tail domain-containing protein [Candidatus Paceibacterota bacterium]